MYPLKLPMLISLGLLTVAPGCSRNAPGAPQRQRVTGLGQTGWVATAEFELLRGGESQLDWASIYPTKVAEIIVDLDEKGDIRINGQAYSLDALKAWSTNTVQTFGSQDPFILRAKPEAPLPTLERVAAIVKEVGVKNVFVLTNQSTERAYAVRLNGQFVPLTSRLEWKEK